MTGKEKYLIKACEILTPTIVKANRRAVEVLDEDQYFTLEEALEIIEMYYMEMISRLKEIKNGTTGLYECDSTIGILETINKKLI